MTDETPTDTDACSGCGVSLDEHRAITIGDRQILFCPDALIEIKHDQR